MIELKNVHFTYGTDGDIGESDGFVPAETDASAGGEGANGSLHDLSLTIHDGELVLLTGESGCGKTTVLRLINGLIPTFYEGKLEGSVSVDGSDVSKAELYDTAKHVSTVFQNPRSQFFNVDTTSELAFACENRGMAEEEILRRMDSTIKDMQLAPLMGRSLFQLSGGQKQKIACASVAVTGNQIILLDEPSANLDLRTIEGLASLLKKWKVEGKTIVVAEHRIAYLWGLADRTIILQGGMIARELSRSQMDTATDAELHELGLRTRKNFPVTGNTGPAPAAAAERYDGLTVVTPSLSLRDFHYKYKRGPVALDIPRMDIPAGKISAITGDNGEGKTTLLTCLCGLGHRCKGTLVYGGRAYRRRARQKLVYLVMQDVNHQLFAESVLDEVLISQNKENEEEAHRILASLDLAEFADRHPQSLSGGQKQRVAVACAIASGRDIMLFDEPTSGLDWTHMKQIGAILSQLKEMGKTVIVVTHDRELVKECCDCEIHLAEYNRAQAETA